MQLELWEACLPVLVTASSELIIGICNVAVCSSRASNQENKAARLDYLIVLSGSLNNETNLLPLD